MYKLSQLIKLKMSIIELLERENINNSIDDFCYILSNFTKNNQDDSLQIKSIIDDTILGYKKIIDQSSDVKNKLNVIIENINTVIDLEKDKLNQSDVFKKTFLTGWSNIFTIDHNINDLIEITIGKYADWHYPGLRLGCRHVGQEQIDILNDDNQLIKDFKYSRYYSNCMVVCDPLYFCDITQDFIRSATDHFNPVYQKRIRTYLLDDIDKLPSGQFGFIFCWMFFNYMDKQTLESFLKKTYDLLRPGGVIMFSYNNIDIEESAKLAELEIMSPISKTQLLEYVGKLGFLCINSYDVTNSDIIVKKISWLELRKDGILTTVKRSQALGEIK